MLHLSVSSKPSFRNYIYNKSPSSIAFFSSIDYKVYAVSWLTIHSVIPEKFSLPEPMSWWELTQITSTSSLWLSLFEYITNGRNFKYIHDVPFRIGNATMSIRFCALQSLERTSCATRQLDSSSRRSLQRKGSVSKFHWLLLGWSISS